MVIAFKVQSTLGVSCSRSNDKLWWVFAVFSGLWCQILCLCSAAHWNVLDVCAISDLVLDWIISLSFLPLCDVLQRIGLVGIKYQNHLIEVSGSRRQSAVEPFASVFYCHKCCWLLCQLLGKSHAIHYCDFATRITILIGAQSFSVHWSFSCSLWLLRSQQNNYLNFWLNPTKGQDSMTKIQLMKNWLSYLQNKFFPINATAHVKCASCLPGGEMV